MYQRGTSESLLIRKVVDIYEESRINDTAPILNTLLEFDNAKDRLFIKLINEDKNRRLLKDIPHRIVQDLAIVYLVYMDVSTEFSSTVTVTNTLLKTWDIDEKTLYTQAVLNTPRLNCTEMCPMQEFIKEHIPAEQTPDTFAMDVTEYNFDNFTMKIDSGDGMPLYIVTNKSKIFGAASLLLPHVMEKIGEFLGSFYVLPSSIHEVLIIPASSAMETSELIGMVRQINETELLPEEVLSDNIYLYDKDEKTFSVITE